MDKSILFILSLNKYYTDFCQKAIKKPPRKSRGGFQFDNRNWVIQYPSNRIVYLLSYSRGVAYLHQPLQYP
jgi:hypothetical protein